MGTVKELVVSVRHMGGEQIYFSQVESQEYGPSSCAKLEREKWVNLPVLRARVEHVGEKQRLPAFLTYFIITHS